MFKRIILIVTTLALLCGAACADTARMELGAPLPDFTVETIDGGSFTLSEALEDHDMVLINIWATWCVYCVQEFPYLQEAYEQYADRVAVIALSTEPGDTPDVMREFAEANGLTFPIGSDVDLGLSSAFAPYGIPVSLVVDRFGNVAFAHTGALSGVGDFIQLFEYFLRDGYIQSVALTELPPALPGVEAADSAALSAAANVEGGTMEFENPEDTSAWPMLPEQTEDRVVLASSNAGRDGSVAAVRVRVRAAEGDALAFAFKTSTEPAMDMLFVSVDGETAKRFSGEHDWTEWALPLEAGEHEIALGYAKDDAAAAGDDEVWIDDVRLVSGGEAEALLAALPEYPVGEAFAVRPENPGAKRIVFEPMQAVFGDLEGSAWILPGGSVTARLTLAEGDDPEVAFAYGSAELTPVKLADVVNAAGDGYEATFGLSDDTVTAVYAYPSAEEASRMAIMALFGDESAVESFLAGSGISWRYAEEEE